MVDSTDSVGRLANAIRGVLLEGADSLLNDIRADIQGMEDRLTKRIDGMNQNMVAMFAEQEKKLDKIIAEKLRSPIRSERERIDHERRSQLDR